ncbi:LTA synthase family protein, partial [Coprococcus eutactus]|nr:LTA synthase family protein [Coprococcus eutactus]
QISDIILMVIPVIIAIILLFTIMAFDRLRWWTNLIGTGIVAVVYIETIMVMWAVDSDVYSPYKLYSQYTSVALAVEKLG